MTDIKSPRFRLYLTIALFFFSWTIFAIDSFATTEIALFPKKFSLIQGESIKKNGVILIMQNDGNFVLYNKEKKPIWHTNTQWQCKYCLAVYEGDGNLSIYNNVTHEKLYSSDTKGSTKMTLSSVGPYLHFTYPETQTMTFLAGTLYLREGQSVDTNGLKIEMQLDGDLVLSNNGQAIWSSKTKGQCARCLAVYQSDGNLVVYDANKKFLPLFATGIMWTKNLTFSSTEPFLKFISLND